MNPQELEYNLQQFSGSDGVHQFNLLFPRVSATDGAMYLAKEAGAFWLLEMIASHTRSIHKEEYFAVARLKVDGSTAVFTLDDGRKGSIPFAVQEIPYTDFPLPEIKLYVGDNGDRHWIIMLPSER